MYIANFRGITKLFLKRPQLVSIAALNLGHRLVHKLRLNGHDGWNHSPEQLSIFLGSQSNHIRWFSQSIGG
jgi:hypothetical protein